MMLFIPFPFSHMFTQSPKGGDESVGREHFPTGEVSRFVLEMMDVLTELTPIADTVPLLAPLALSCDHAGIHRRPLRYPLAA
jgi:hypothetical protein